MPTRVADEVRVEVAGWFVGKDQSGPPNEGSGACDTLLLTAGRLARTVGQSVPDARGWLTK